MLKNSRMALLGLACVSSSASLPATAKVVRITIDKRAPVDDAGNAGKFGPYELIRGRIFGEVDPKTSANDIIQDIKLAPRNSRGMVEYISTYSLLRPVNGQQASGVLLSSVSNRGRRLSPSWRTLRGLVDPAFYDVGLSVLWVGWQGDLPEKPSADASAAGLMLESMRVPVAKNLDGSPLTGPYLMRFPVAGTAGPKGTTLRLDQGGAGELSYPPADFDTRKASLIGGLAEDKFGRPAGPHTAISAADWKWWDCKLDTAPTAATPAGNLCIKLIKGEFDPKLAYTLVFQARDPLVLGLGMAAMRDAVSFFRYAKVDDVGTPNPVAGEVKHVVSQGQSQVGNFVRTFIALGFNADEQGRRVWDGANTHIGGRRTPINYRFATPGSSPTLFMPGSEGVLWWGKATDAVRGGPARSNLDRCTNSGTCPKIIETFGASELWNQRFTPDLVGFGLKRDIPLPGNVRRYYLPGTTHGGGQGTFALSLGSGECTVALNPNPQTDQMRALTFALVDWVAKGKAPPRSAYPTLAGRTLVPDEKGKLAFPAIPGAPAPYGLSNPVLVYDFGHSFNTADMSGVIAHQPPSIRKVVPARVAQVDRDGNETSGVPSVQMMAPLGTYTGWNTYDSGPYAGQVCSFNGGFIPFPKDKAERLEKHDPRLSITERYKTRAGYVAAVTAAVAKARRDGFLLATDGDRIIREAVEATQNGPLAFLPQ